MFYIGNLLSVCSVSALLQVCYSIVLTLISPKTIKMMVISELECVWLLRLFELIALVFSPW